MIIDLFLQDEGVVLAPFMWRVPPIRGTKKQGGWNCDVCIMHTCWHDNNHTAYSSKNVIISNLCVYIQSLSLKTHTHTHIIKRTVNKTRGKYIFHLTGYLLGPGSEGWDHMDVSLEPSAGFALRKRSPNWCPSNRSDRTGPGMGMNCHVKLGDDEKT